MTDIKSRVLKIRIERASFGVEGPWGFSSEYIRVMKSIEINNPIYHRIQSNMITI